MRPNSEFLDNLIDKPFPLLDHGYLMVKDYMGTEQGIIDSARVSYGRGTSRGLEDAKLLRYLLRHRHCYHHSMEVFTIDGWKKWGDCAYEETFVVPDPITRTLRLEKLPVEMFDCEEPLEVFKSDRMSYRVTQDHRMWFKSKCSETFEVVRAGKMPRWGHFDPMAGYRAPITEEGKSPLGKLLGFILGDGSWSGNALTFHLRKERKKEYLRGLLRDLDCSYSESQSSTYEDAIVVYLPAGEVTRLELQSYLVVGERTADKHLTKLLPEHVSGIFDGLINSDGHINVDRNSKIEFGSVSSYLVNLFETVAALCGYDAHRGGTYQGVIRTTAHPTGRTSLEARKQYFSTEYYEGKVFCATTSTGMLLVRGASDEFAFVCGNTTPFEMAEIKIHVKLPIFVARQWIRHRTANVNEYSGRYSIMDKEFYIPNPEQLAAQSQTNKQGRGRLLNSAESARVLQILKEDCARNYDHYLEMANVDEEGKPLDNGKDGLARELARMGLSLNFYTQWYWKTDVHNLLHFIHLRADSHAQYEIQVYANVLKDILKGWLPNVYQAAVDYKFEAENMSRMEMEVIRFFADQLPKQGMNTMLDNLGVVGRERQEFYTKLGL